MTEDNENIEEIKSQEDLSLNEVDKAEDALIQEETEKKEQTLTREESVDKEEDEENQELISVRPVKFQQFEPTPANRAIKKNLDIMQDISMHVSVELGRTKSSIREIMELEKGSIVELDKIAGEQVEIFVNDKFVAKGEVIVIEDKFGVRVTSTAISKK